MRFRSAHSASRTPVTTSAPALRRISKPLPAWAGFGSAVPTTTLRIPALTSASVQAPVRPSVEQGSIVT